MKLNYELVKTLFTYNPDTGLFLRVKKISWKGNVYDCKPFEPKSISTCGYLQVNLCGRPQFVHRLIFLYMTGSLPSDDVDHINGERLDNRWCNLRQVTRSENLHNVGVRSDNTTGVQGVSKRSDTGKFHAYINHHGERFHLGNFGTLEEAIDVRKEAMKNLNFHSNHGGRSGWVKS